MEELYQKLFDAVEAKKQMVLDAERYIWKNPEPGYKEWKTHAYLKAEFEKLGYEVVEFSNIPGFYVDVETGRPGPKVAVFGEMDSLIIPNHPECDPETGAVHSCGHNCQCATILGVAIAFKAPGATDGLSGSIRLIAVPAEELIEVEYRRELREKGIIRYFGGKLELIYRGILDDVDMAMMVHTAGKDAASVNAGSNGCVVKKATFIGKSAHAGGSPHNGINALYAAQNALNAANALRETFKDLDHIRFHPIISEGGAVVNAIPNNVVVESYVRGATMEAIADANDKVNRAFAGAAASIGCRLVLEDQHGYAPRHNDENLVKIFKEIGDKILPPERVKVNSNFGTGCSDMGDVSTLMPAIHPYCGGAAGIGHGTDYRIEDPELACVTAAKLQAGMIAKLLRDDAAAAQYVLANKKIVYQSKEEYLKAIDSLSVEYDAVTYQEDGTITLKYKA